MVDLVAIEEADGALAIFPLSDIFVPLVVSVPFHLGCFFTITRIPHAIDKVTGVSALIVWPLVDTLTIPHIIDECSLEGALIVVVHDRTLTVQLAILVPVSSVCAGANFDNTFAGKFTGNRVVVISRGAVPHCEHVAFS